MGQTLQLTKASFTLEIESPNHQNSKSLISRKDKLGQDGAQPLGMLGSLCMLPRLSSFLFSFSVIKDCLHITILASFGFRFSYSNSLMDFQPNTYVKFFLDSFRSTFLYMSHLSRSKLSSIGFERFRNSFDPKNSVSGSIQLHQLSSHAVVGHIPQFVTHILGAFKLWPSLQVVFG